MEILLGKCCLEWHLLEHKLQLALLKAFKMKTQIIFQYGMMIKNS